MLKNVKKISILLLTTIFIFSSVEANWITKKSDKPKEVIKEEKKQKSKWIKLKKKEIKKNKEEFKKEEKKITSEVKSWITKKSKKKFINSINDLPKGAIYFTGSNDTKSIIFYGYVIPDKESELVNGFYKTSKGISFFSDGKTTCQIGSTVLIVDQGELTSRVSGNCTNGLKFAGKTSQTKNTGWGQAKTSDGKEKLNFEFNTNKTEIAKLYKDNTVEEKTIARRLPNKNKITLKPNGKYYALLIGNSNYIKWSSLKSPINDVNEIGKILKTDYKFEKVMVVPNGTRKDIFKNLKKLSKITTDKDYVLIYYSGHGEEDGNQRYWIPVDGELESGFGDWININDIQLYIQNHISNTHIVMMSDSCYFAMETKGNQIKKDKKSESYQKLLERRAVMIVGSGSNEPVLDTSQDKHSMFGMSLIQSLKNNTSAIRMRDIVENIVLAHSGMQQQPYGIGINAWGHSGGDFIFISKK